MPTIKLTGFNPATGGSGTAGDTGTAEIDGSVVLGNADSDTIVVNAEFDSHLVPDDDNTYDLGESNKRWRKGYFDEIVGKLPHVNTAKYTEGDAVQRYVRWDAAGSNGFPGVNNKFVAPANGQLVSVRIRATAGNPAPGNTTIALHKASNGTEDLNTNPTESVVVNMTSGNTTYEAGFINNTFSAGDILGISLSPSSGFGNVNITCVWMFEWGV